MEKIILAIPHIQQREDGECVPACAAMALNHLGLSVPYQHLIELLKTNWFGTPAFRIRELEKLGVVIVYKQGTLAEVAEHLLQNRPCIAFVKTANLPYWGENIDHAVVIAGLDDQSVYLNDPAFADAPKQVARGDFELAWLERDEYYAALKRK